MQTDIQYVYLFFISDIDLNVDELKSVTIFVKYIEKHFKKSDQNPTIDI